MFSKLWYGTKFVLDTVKGVMVVLASPNMKIPPAKLDPHMPARPWTITQWIRMFSWRYNWQYMPVFRFWVFSTIAVTFLWIFVLPAKPHHLLVHSEINHAIHHAESTKWYGRMQKHEDEMYFKKYDPYKQFEN